MANAVCPGCGKGISVMVVKCPHCDWDFRSEHEVKMHNTQFIYSDWATFILIGGMALSVLASLGSIVVFGISILSFQIENALVSFSAFVITLADAVVIMRVMDLSGKK